MPNPRPTSATTGLRWRDSAAAASARLRTLTVRGATSPFGVAPSKPPANRLTRSVLFALESGAKVPFTVEEADPVQVTITLLQAAAEVEHALMVEYLYGYFSLNPDADFGVNHGDAILDIAIEEMGHLMTVQNLLVALGAPPHFGLQAEAPTPGQEAIYPFPLRLRPLTKSALAGYVTAEAPNPLPDGPDGLGAEDRTAAQQAEEEARQDLGNSVKHVGLLYARLLWLFQEANEGGGPQDFTEDMSEHFGDMHLPANLVLQTDQQEPTNSWSGRAGFFVESVATREDAKRVLRRIAVQGEGWDTNEATEPSHFERLLTAYRAYPSDAGGVLLSTAENPRIAGDPPWPGPVNGAEVASAMETVAVYFRLRYELLVRTLSLILFAPPGSPVRAQLRRHSLNTGMRRGIGALSQALVENGSGPLFRLLRPVPTASETLKTELLELMDQSAAATGALPPSLQTLASQLGGQDATLRNLLSAIPDAT